MQPSTRRWPAGHPPLWIVLIGANIGCFLVQVLARLSQMGPADVLAQMFAGSPSPGVIEEWLGVSRMGVEHHFYWQFLTYAFLHGNLLHLAGNLILLYFAGREVEALVGTKHFLGIYFGGGLVGSILHWNITHLPLVGASACVFAVLFAFTTILPELEMTCLLFYVIPVRLKAKHLAWIVVAASVAFLATGSYLQVAHYAHLGGGLFGWLYVKQMGYGNPWRIQRYLLERRQQAERHKHMSATQFIAEEIDPILEKISRDGVESLSRHERRLLQMGREKIEKGRR